MGLFSNKSHCSICNSKKAKEVKDGYVCDNCWKSCGIFVLPFLMNRKIATIDEVKERIELNVNWKKNQENRKKEFAPTYAVGGNIMVDKTQQLWSLANGAIKKKPTGAIYSFDEIESYEVDEDGETVTKGGLGRAVVGGLAFGGVGAVVGGVTGSKKTKTTCTKLTLVISIKNLPNSIPVPLIFTKTKKNSPTYNLAQNKLSEITDFLDKAIESSQNNGLNEESQNSITELENCAKLFEQGIITEDEFKKIKEKLISKI